MSIEILCNPMADLGGVLFNCTVIFSLALLNDFAFTVHFVVITDLLYNN